MRRSGSLPRRKRIRSVSAKRRREQTVRRSLPLPDGERCWLAIPGVCTGRAEAWHELVGSGVGGSRTDPSNLCAACGSCNTTLERRPERYAMGWKVPRSEAVPGDGGLVPGWPHPLALAWHRDLTGDCEQDCQERCAYPGEFAECSEGA